MESSNNFFELIDWLQKNIDWLNQVLKGGTDDSIVVDGEVKPSITKDIKDHFSGLQSMISGRLAYQTKDELLAAGAPPEDKPLAEVWNDPIIGNNGLYGYSEGWIKSPYDMQSLYKLTASYLEGAQTSNIANQDRPNLYSDYNHKNPSMMWQGAFSESERVFVNSRPCLRLGGGMPGWSRYSKAFTPDDFPSGFVSASMKVEAFGAAKDSGTSDRMMILQYSTEFNSVDFEVARAEVFYKKEDAANGYAVLRLDQVPIHPDAKSIFLYSEANTWDISVSEICISDGERSDYRFPINTYMDKQLWPTGSLKVDGADKVSGVSSYDDTAGQLTLVCSRAVIGYVDYVSEATGDLSPGAKLIFSAELYADVFFGCDLSLFQYDKDGAEIARHDLKYTKNGGEWQYLDIRVDVLPDTESIKGRVVNRGLTLSETEQTTSVSFRKVRVKSLRQSNEIIDPVSALSGIHKRVNNTNGRVQKLETNAVTNFNVANLVKDPYRFTDFSLSSGNSINNHNGNWHVFLNPSASNAKALVSMGLPAYFFPSGKISAGVTLSRRPQLATGVRAMLIQYDSSGSELTREETRIASDDKAVDENDQETWVPISFVDIPLHEQAYSVRLFLDSGSNHIWGVWFTKPWLVDGVALSFIPIQNFPNYWVDPEWRGVALSSISGDQVGSKGKDTWGNYLTLNSTGGTLARRYYVPAENIFRPGNSGFLRASLKALGGTESGGAEIGLLFLDKDGQEIDRTLLKNEIIGKYQTLGVSFNVPDETDKVQIRFVIWGSKANQVYFRDVILSDSDNGSVNRSFSVFNSLPATETSGKVVYMSPNGNDTNDGSKAAPKLTLSGAYGACGPNGRIVVLDGEYGKESFTVPDGANLTIMAEGMSRPRFINGDEYTGQWTRTAGTTKVWQLNTTLAPNKFIFEHMTPEGAIQDVDRHPLHRGRTHRLPSFRLKSARTVEELDQADNGGWYFDSAAGVLYITTATGDDPNTHRYFRPGYSMIRGSGSRDNHLNLEGIESWYAPINFAGLGSYLSRDCRVIGSRSDGCKRDGARGVEHRMEFAGADNDGSNSHNVNAPITGLAVSDVPAASTIVSFDMYCHDNWDDGDSLHERCEGEYHGGLWEWNGDRGVATAYGAHVLVYNGIARDNGNNGQSSGLSTSSGEGFSSLGRAIEEEGGQGTQMICFSCESYRNNVNFSAYGEGCTLICNQTISRDARVVGYLAKAGLLIAKNCFESGSAQAKLEEDGGQIIIENAGALT
ncbi:TPA: hypothetical protein I7138_20230 [Vibrio vulnificus]|nr:hypothetical protein [Vibrio vulnificus]